jgi:hypothetical protein
MVVSKIARERSLERAFAETKTRSRHSRRIDPNQQLSEHLATIMFFLGMSARYGRLAVGGEP